MLSWSSNYPFGSYGSSSVGVAYGGGKGGVGPRTIHLSSHKVGCWIYGVDFMSSWGSLYSISFQVRGKSAIPLLDNGLVVIHQTLIEKDMEYRRADISVGPRGSYGPIKGTPGILKYRRTTGVSGSGRGLF